jgi:hypothetical protein
MSILDPFPMTARGEIEEETTALTDVMHGILGAVTYLLVCS